MAQTRLRLDPSNDVLQIQMGDTSVSIQLTEKEMVELSMWAFGRKVSHIIFENRTTDRNGIVPIRQGA